MDGTKREELEKACKKIHKVRTRLVAVRMVRVLNISVEETANLQVHCPTWVRDWLRCYDEGDIEGLRDLPRCERPRRILQDTLDRIMAKVVYCGIMHVDLQQRIRKKTGVKLHITYVRKIMHRHNRSPKALWKIHVNRANKKAVQNWKYRFNRRVSRLEKDGFTIMEDKAIFIHDVIVGRKYWSPVGHSISVSYTGSHKRIVAYGSIVRDGRQFFRMCEKFDGPTFVQYLKDLHRCFGKVTVVTAYRTSQYRPRRVREFLRNNKDIKKLD